MDQQRLGDQVRLQYINEKDVSRITGRSLSGLRNDRSLGRGLPYRKWGARVYYRLDEVIQFMEQRKVATDQS